jgi:hypothetical protein
MFSSTTLADVKVTTHEDAARFPSIESWVYTDIKVWMLTNIPDDMQFDCYSVRRNRR